MSAQAKNHKAPQGRASLKSPERSEVTLAYQAPLPPLAAWASVARCVLVTARLLAARRVHQPRTHVGQWLCFADGSVARVYRETVVDRSLPSEPTVLVVGFRLRAVRGRSHDLFRRESLLNTPLFVGFPGFTSKLWLADDENGVYRGLYQWDGAQRAEKYARALWRVLALVSVPGSIAYYVLPGLLRDDLLGDPGLAPPDGTGAWWRLTAAPARVP
jgi:hypothetical protein